MTIPALTLSGITGSTQCAQVNSAGVVSGTGSACGTGAGGANANGYYWVGQSTSAPANAVNIGGLSTGLLKISVSCGVATPSAAAAGTDYAAATNGTSAQGLTSNGSGGFGAPVTFGALATSGFPGSGIPNSTGSAWGASYTTTGSGNVVLATSPTLVTPALGIPSSGTLTNATGLPLSTGVTGTLPVANGGTGTGSTLTGLVRGNSSAMTAAELSGDAITSGSNAVTLATKYKTITCQPGLGDGLNAITSGTYRMSECLNDFGAAWTITAIKCYTDNNGTSTMNVSNGSGTGLLTGAVTCSNSWAAGTQSGTTRS